MRASMNNTKADVYYEGENCFVMCDALDFVGLEGKYVLWMDGTRRGTFKVWTRYRDEISDGKNVYFMLKNIGIFKNHVDPVEGHEGLYVYTPKGRSA